MIQYNTNVGNIDNLNNIAHQYYSLFSYQPLLHVCRVTVLCLCLWYIVQTTKTTEVAVTVVV